ncbi:MAG: glycosyltransferase, partial [Armatimonadota bacterium]|nr:glycosyltransferase [bacterium]MDW8322178.1 glycosyltransferase [Armatimonadota bacterium]
EIRVVTLLSPKAYVHEMEVAGVPVATLNLRRKVPDPRAIVRLARYVRLWKPHIVHSYMVQANLLARTTRLLASIPALICSIRSVSEGSRLREVLYRITDPLCDITTHVCRVGAERYVNAGAVSAHKMRYIPNGVDTAVFCPDTEARAHLRTELDVQHRFVWLAVGRFEPPKDYPTMLTAFAEVAKNYSNCMLLLAGDGALRGEMEKMAHSLGIQSRVRFLGIRHDIPQLMNAADAYVMSSSREGLPNVLLEAHATGLPAVTTDVGGNREIVVEGTTGFVVPARNPNALAEAMRRMMDMDEHERLQMGTAGRQYIVENYSMERVVQQWEDLYREMLNRKGTQIVQQG